MTARMRTELFDYDLPPELIAQSPLPRGESRLLVLHRETGQIEHRRFTDLPEYLYPGDLLVVNDTRVTARRLQGVRENGHEAEILLVRPVGDRSWEALVKPGRALRPGRFLRLLGPKEACVPAEVTATTPDGGRILQFADAATRDALAHWGEAPLPPYIHAPLAAHEEERYQTVYAAHGGSTAAPTAGLHFTEELLESIRARDVGIERVTLHVGVGTFRPVRTEHIEDHEMHGESALLTPETAARINSTQGRIVAVGTTSVRTLETAAAAASHAEGAVHPRVAPFAGESRLFITPGYTFRAVDALITNFHLPRSTLLMLVSAFAGTETTRNTYRAAVEQRYRFFSFGDAMLII